MNVPNLRFDKCPCCLESNFKVFYRNSQLKVIEKPEDFMFGSNRFIGTIVKCPRCGFHFINDFEKNFIEHYRRLSVEESERLQGFRISYYSSLKTKLEKFVPIDIDGMRALDIGCGDGTWLSCLTRADRFGTEYSLDYLPRLKALNIQVVDFPSPMLPQFDLITLFDVFEHLLDPEIYLLALKRALKPGGVLVISCPDMGKWVARLLGSKYYLYCPMHFSYFNRRNINLMLKRFFDKSLIKVFSAPVMKTDFWGAAKWLGVSKLFKGFNFQLPVGYSANFIAVVRAQPEMSL